MNDTYNIDELDLSPIIKIVNEKKFFILLASISVSIIFFLSSFLIPNKYHSFISLQPLEDQTSNIPGQLGGIAAFAGINIQDKGNKTDLALKILTSTDFFETLYQDEEFLIDLMATKNFSSASGKISIDSKKYDVKSKKWVRDHKNPKPTVQESHEVFLKSISQYVDKNTQFVEISFVHISPYIAQKWLTRIIDKLNETVKEMETKRAELSLKYLMLQISKTDVAAVQEVISNLIQKELSILTISAGNKSYVFDIIDSPRVPEKKSSPSRIRFLLIGFVISIFFFIPFVIYRSLKSKKSAY